MSLFKQPTPIEQRRDAIIQRGGKRGYRGRVCLTCFCALPIDARRHRRFCSSGCRVNFWRRCQVGIRQLENAGGQLWTIDYLRRAGELLLGVELECVEPRDLKYLRSGQERRARRKERRRGCTGVSEIPALLSTRREPRRPGELSWNEYKAQHGLD
jgi:hypothetical protein